MVSQAGLLYKAQKNYPDPQQASPVREPVFAPGRRGCVPAGLPCGTGIKTQSFVQRARTIKTGLNTESKADQTEDSDKSCRV